MPHLDEGTIHAWLDGALTAGEARQAEAHVAGCAACAGAVAEARGFIAASSMILSKLDGVMPARDAQPAGPDLSIRDIAVARAEAAVRPRPGVRRWFAGSPMRAAAAVLLLAGGVAVVGNMTTRDELAGVVADAAMERAAGVATESAADQAISSASGNATVARDATVAEVEREEAAPPPTVTAAPALPRPVPVAGGGAAGRQAVPAVPARVADGVLAGVAIPSAPTTDATTGTAASASSSGGAGAGEQRAEQRLEQRLRRVEPSRERDFAEAGRPGAMATASAPAAVPAPAPAPAPPLMESMRRADSTLSLQSARRATEQRLAPQAAKALVEPPARTEAAAAAADIATVLAAPRCYALALAPWRPAGTVAPDAPPTRIVLSPDTGTAGAARGQPLVRPMPGAPEGRYAAAWWTEVSPSTLVLTWATGPEGIVMRLVRSGGELSGTARTFGTAGGVERTSTVTGTAVDCGAAR